MDAETKDRLREALEKRNMRPIDLANKTGMTRGAISQYLSGKITPKQDKLYLMAQALGVDPVWLMGKNISIEDNVPPPAQQAQAVLLALFGEKIANKIGVNEVSGDILMDGVPVANRTDNSIALAVATIKDKLEAGEDKVYIGVKE